MLLSGIDQYGGTMLISGTVNLYGGQLNGGFATEYGGAICLDGGTFNMYGGIIKECKVNNDNGGADAGAVEIRNDGIFNMINGEIFSCSANGAGGAVRCSDGIFNMYGGVIENCGSYEKGGAVYVLGNSIFNMTGGEITMNSCETGEGQVYVSADYYEDVPGSDLVNYVCRMSVGGNARIIKLAINGTDGADVYLEGGKTIEINDEVPPITEGPINEEWNQMFIGITTTEGFPRTFVANGATKEISKCFYSNRGYEIKLSEGTLQEHIYNEFRDEDFTAALSPNCLPDRIGDNLTVSLSIKAEKEETEYSAA